MDLRLAPGLTGGASRSGRKAGFFLLLFFAFGLASLARTLAFAVLDEVFLDLGLAMAHFARFFLTKAKR